MIRKIILITFLLIFPATILSQETGLKLKPEKINPGSSLYLAKRTVEKIQGILLLSQEKKVSFNDKLVRIRLSELNYLVENKNTTPIEQASNRFSAQAGVFIDELLKLNRDKENEKTLKWFSLYENKLGELRDNFPSNSSNWLLLQQNIDTLATLGKKIT